MAAAETQLVDVSLLSSRVERSDGPSSLAQPLKLFVETLVPMRSEAFEMDANDTVQTLRARWMELQGSSSDWFETRWHLVYDGIELADDAATLVSCGLKDGSNKLIALEQTTRRGVVGFALRWSPLLASVCTACALVAAALDNELAECDVPLRLFVSVGSPLLLPYGLALSGVVQAERGHRLLWFWPFPALVRAMGITMLFALIWLGCGGAWLARARGSECAEQAPSLYEAGAVLWVLLFLASLPVFVFLVTPCCAACRVPVAFDIIAFMAGRHRMPDNSGSAASKAGEPQKETRSEGEEARREEARPEDII